MRTDLLGVSQVLVDAVRRDWPFVARKLLLRIGTAVPLRPATVLLLASYAGSPNECCRPARRGTRLSHLGAPSPSSVVGMATPGNGHDTNRGNTFAGLTGDYLLAKAYALTAHVSAEICVTVADAVPRAREVSRVAKHQPRGGWTPA